MKLSEWAKKAKEQVDSLDADLIAMHALGFSDRVDLILHAEDEFDFEIADEFLKKRASGTPMAYILGYKEFYGRKFAVDPNVLIPRPETEQMVISALGIIDVEKMNNVSILDIGTGSGCIPTTLKLELNKMNIWSDVVGVDVSVPALDLAQENADDMGAEVRFFCSDLLAAIDELPDIITANLPYVDIKWNWTSKELKYEPALALFADDGGLKLIKKLLDQIAKKKNDDKKRFLILEADTSQLSAIIDYATERKFELISKEPFTLSFKY